MRKLWLDDVRDPRDPEIQELFGAEPGVVWVKTAEAAIARLKSQRVDWISFDHDLGTTATGLDVAIWMEAQARQGSLPRISWAIHSANTKGASAIRRVMEQAEQHWSRWELHPADQTEG
jgi:hypothetical protein